MEAQVVKIVAKQLQVDHAHKLTLGGKTDMQAYSQVHKENLFQGYKLRLAWSKCNKC